MLACERYLGVQGLFTQEMNAQASYGELYSRLALTITSPGPWGFSASIVSCYQSNTRVSDKGDRVRSGKTIQVCALS